ncbi:TPA: plasmid SOS inhibition protein A [Providencia rettgeri]|nr:plasmid SOS inhibition protein A [Providencia rettgeri]
MASTALVPLNRLQQCAMSAIAYIEARTEAGRSLGEYPYAKAFFREFTGKAGITSAHVRQVDPTYNPSYRGEATKTDYIRAIDTIIESRGKTWIIPLSKAVITAMFPAVQSGEHQRISHREKIATARSARREQKQKREEMSASENAQSAAWVGLQFCLPGEHKAWLAHWRDELEMAGVSDWELRNILVRWWGAFWIASAPTDWRWCDTLYDLLNELDYVISTSSERDLCLCRSALPLALPA